ncbi:hypothetical protein OTU49_000478 [Cherax quadricarinatus]|uniref:Uncharacterized protein n=1 Tax=Cherax quadricarinatus TaxID=27406 RepID=A0AAW0Y0M9_CHEQU
MRKWYVDSMHKMEIYGAQVQSLQPTTVYKYLGMHFSSAGKGKPNIQKLCEKLVALQAPLKSQQHLNVLNKHLIPGIIRMVLGGVCQNTLKTLDKLIRQMVKKWLKFPKDTPINVYYAPTAAWGLGCICLSTRVPILWRNNSEDLVIPNLAIHPNTIKALRFVGRSKVRNVVVTTRRQELKEWTNVLVGSLDGVGLKEHHFAPQVHKWMANGTNLTKGATYIDALKINII